MLLTPDDVAELLQVNKSWVYEAARDGRIPHVRLGRYVRFEPEEIEAWLKTQRSEPLPNRSRSVNLK
jgi:excisionase family DNA binding protein